MCKLITYIILFLIISFTSQCSLDNDNSNPDANPMDSVQVDTSAEKLIGKWKQIAFRDIDGTRAISDGKEIEFQSNDLFRSNNFDGCDGTYEVSKNLISVEYPCRENDTLFYLFEIRQNNLELTPTGNSVSCDEGCTEIYEALGN